MAAGTVTILAMMMMMMTVMMVKCEEQAREAEEEIIYGEKEEEEGRREEKKEGEGEEKGEMGVTEAWIMRRPFPPPHPYPHPHPPFHPYPHPRPPIHAYHNPLPPRPRTPTQPRPLPSTPARPPWPREKTGVQTEDGGGMEAYWGGQRSRVRSGQGYMTNGSLSEALNVLWTNRDGDYHAHTHNYGTSNHKNHDFGAKDHNQSHNNHHNRDYHSLGNDQKYDYDYGGQNLYNHVTYDHKSHDLNSYNDHGIPNSRNALYNPPSSPYDPQPPVSTLSPSRYTPYNHRVKAPPTVHPQTKIGGVAGSVGVGRGPNPARGGVSRGAAPPHTPAGPLGVPGQPSLRPQVGRQPLQPLPPRVQPFTPITPLHPPVAPGRYHPHVRAHPAPAFPRTPAPQQPPLAPLQLTPYEAAQLNRLLSNPLWRRHFLGAANRVGLADTIAPSLSPLTSPSISSDPYSGGGWMTGVGAAVGGVADSLPSLDRAVTTMSFLAFGIFMANLIVQAVANTTSLASLQLLGREDKSNSLPLSQALSSLPLDLSSFMMDEGEEEEKEEEEGRKREEEQWMRVEDLEESVDVISDVYLNLHDIARAGLAQVAGALGVGGGGGGEPWGGGSTSPGRLPPGLNLPPECVRRLLCEVHQRAPPAKSHLRGYSLLPFWTAAVGWLRGPGEGGVPTLLEEMRAEVAGQAGKDCSSLFPSCPSALLHPVRRLLEEEEEEEEEEGRGGRVILYEVNKEETEKDEEEEEEEKQEEEGRTQERRKRRRTRK